MGVCKAMRQQILGSHTPPCHRRMVITTQFNVLPCCTAAQTSSVPLQVAFDCALAVCTPGSARTHHPHTLTLALRVSLSLWPFALWASFSLSLRLALFTLPRGFIFLLTLPGGFSSFSPSPPFLSVPLSPVSLPRLPPPLCLLAHFRHIAVCMAVCSATCKGTIKRPPLPGPFA